MVLVAMVPGIILFWSQNQRRFDESKASTIKTLQQSSSVLGVIEEDNLANTLSLMGSVATAPGLMDIGDPTCGPLLRGLLDHAKADTELFAASTDGVVVCSSDPTYMGLDMTSEEWFALTLVSPEPIVSSAPIGRNTSVNVPVLVATMAVPGPDGGPNMVIGAVANLNKFVAESQELASLDFEVSLIGPDQAIRAQVPDRESAIAGSAAPSWLADLVTTDISQVVDEAQDSAGRHMLVSVNHIGDSSGATIVVSADADLFLASARADRRRGLLILGLASLGAIAVAQIVIELAFFGPIRRFRNSLPVASNVVGSSSPTGHFDEITSLAQTLESYEGEVSHREVLAVERIADALAASHAERAKLAAAIHDDSIQAMTVVVLQHDLWDQALPDGEMRDRVRDLRSAARDAIERLRSLSLAIESSEVPDSLASVSNLLLTSTFEGTGMETHLRAEPTGAVSSATIGVVYMVMREALMNSRVHADAERVDVEVLNADGGTRIIISDDGRGFDAGSVLPRRGHYGLQSMRDRIASIGGTLSIVSTEGHGTSVTIDLPADS